MTRDNISLWGSTERYWLVWVNTGLYYELTRRRSRTIDQWWHVVAFHFRLINFNIPSDRSPLAEEGIEPEGSSLTRETPGRTGCIMTRTPGVMERSSLEGETELGGINIGNYGGRHRTSSNLGSGVSRYFGGISGWLRWGPSDDRGYAYTLVDNNSGMSTRRSRAGSWNAKAFGSFPWCFGSISLASNPVHPGSRLQRATFALVALAAIASLVLTATILWCGGLPRPYTDIWDLERSLRQHRWELRPEVARNAGVEPGESSRSEGFLRFPDHPLGLGLNNVLEESFVKAHIAHLTNRSYVFEDYVWSILPVPYTIYDFSFRPTRMPLNAFVSGFIAGGNLSSTALDSSLPVHLSISSRYYEYICPHKHRTVLSVKSAPKSFKDANEQLEWWASHIKTLGMGKRCVEVSESYIGWGRRVVDWGFFGSRIHIKTLIPQLFASPVLRGWEWSPLVTRGALRRLFKLGLLPTSGKLALGGHVRGSIVPGLLAIHLRRGDYQSHCRGLSSWGAGFMGFNLATEIPAQDIFERPNTLNVKGKEAKTALVEAHYIKRCLPNIQQVVERAGAVRRDWNLGLKDTNTTSGHPLSKVLVVSNGQPSFLEQLHSALRRDGWEVLSGALQNTTEMERWSALEEATMIWDERDVGAGIDMALAERAEVFLGNGFSTLSGNVILFRLAEGKTGFANRLL